jgi:hypothetical protein
VEKIKYIGKYLLECGIKEIERYRPKDKKYALILDEISRDLMSPCGLYLTMLYCIVDIC